MLLNQLQTLAVGLLLCVFSGSNLIAQYCLNGGPSSPDDSNVQSVFLSGSVGAINYTGCPGVLGLEDQTALQQVSLDVGNFYSASIVFGTCGGSYAAAGEAWIDFNSNQQFESTESIGSWQGMPPSNVQSFNFQVPAGAISGSVRMRVMMQEAASLPLDPCASYTWGSMVDFSITIQNGVSCIGYFGNDPSDAIEINTYPYADTNSTVICYSNNSYVYSSPDVFYLAVLDPSKDSLKASLCESDFDTYLTVQNMAGDVLFYNDDHADCAPHSQIIFPTAGLDSVYIVVEGWNNLVGAYILNIDNDYKNSNTSTASINSPPIRPVVYPNPTSNLLTIETSSLLSSSIYGMNGRCLKVFGDSPTLELDFLPPGIYVLEITCFSGLFREKIIKH